jgi:hypothetical protein
MFSYVSFQIRLGDSVSSDFERILDGMTRVGKAIECVLQTIDKFKILDENLIPFGLKPIARSISWLVEQIIVQSLYEISACNPRAQGPHFARTRT